tara:strand:+ start:2735 stop:3010 length:276 start_codon:yes stop_codon:yes gene_type:complete
MAWDSDAKQSALMTFNLVDSVGAPMLASDVNWDSAHWYRIEGATDDELPYLITNHKIGTEEIGRQSGGVTNIFVLGGHDRDSSNSDLEELH